MEITKDILYVGVNDHLVDLFEGQYDVPNGMAYNSYLICDEKVAVMDSVDAHFTDEWITKIAAALGERAPDYFIVQHMEPDHSGSVAAFAQAYPETTIIASAQAFNMIKAYFGTDYADRRIVVKEGDTLPLGRHTLHFVTAPMVHWPEVIMTYDDADKVLFSADAFGKFGALDVEEPWLPEARRYFIGIVGKYGVQVQAVLKKAAGLDIETVCSLHGPVLHKEQLGDVLAAYDTWSAYRPETEGVLVAYSSIYGHTAEAAAKLAEALRAKGVETVSMDLARCDMAEAVAQAFRFSKLVLATPTYNADVFPFMKDFINHLTERNYQNRTVAFIENGSWAPMAAKVMRKMLENSKALTFADTTVTVKEVREKETPELDDEFAKKVGFDTFDELVEQLKSEITSTKAEQLPRLKESRCVTELSRRIKGDIPDAYLDYTRENILRDFFNSLQEQGTTFDQFLSSRGITGEQFREDLEAQSREEAEECLALDALFTHLDMSIGEEDIEKEFSVANNPEATRKAWEDAGRMSIIREAIRRQRATKWLVDNAVVTIDNGTDDEA